MTSTKSLRKKIITLELEENSTENIIDKYKILDEKCDEVLKKIRKRKFSKNGKKEQK